MDNHPAHLDLHIEFHRRLLELRLALQQEDLGAISTKTQNLANAQASLDRVHATADGCRSFTGSLHLSDTEAQVVWLLAAAHLDRNVRVLLGRTTGVDAAEPTLESLRTTVYGTESSSTAFRELGPEGVLRRLGLIERTDDQHAAHDARQTWSVSARILGLLHGEVAATSPGQRGDISTECFAEATRSALSAATDARAVILVEGAAHSGRRTILTTTWLREQRAVLATDLRRLPAEHGSLRSDLRELALECRLTGKVPLLCNLDALDAERLAIVANEFAPLIEGNILVTSGVQRPNVQWDRPVVVIEMGQPTHAQRAALWHETLGQGTAEDAERLAGQYPLAPGLIVRASEAAKARCAGREMEAADIYAGIRAVLDERLGAYARRITVTQTWADIVLPPDQIDSIVELMARVRGRHKVYETWGFGAKVGKGLGVSALFSGPPGTGKTMVAGLIAKELGLELYQVDMAKVVSKFIGETEKNLAALFDAAEAGHAILLFDEADSLFGKRTEVRSSNDRYANLETNYLLQRLETFTGICLLTSNHESNMDPAFQRRLSLHLRFILPDAEERAAMWEAVLPKLAPVAGAIDFAGLGERFAMSGGYIKNAALRAAFLAADRNEAITEALLERAARVEYEGMGKLAA